MTGTGHTRSGRRVPGGLENEVLATLAAAGTPLTSAEVLARLGKSLAYTTVMTTLVRLRDKGVIARARSGRAFAYRIVDAPTVCARKMCQVLETAESREVVLARFLDELDPADVPTLQRLLGESERARDDRGSPDPSDVPDELVRSSTGSPPEPG